jgi:uncharacterized membrane protein YeaQ/YmgE (transglycosylase-associated protein family)
VAVVALVLIAIVALVLIGWLIVGVVLKLIWWALLGLVIGALARLILPGKQHVGILETAGAGIAAALVGGIIAHVIGLGGFLQFVVAVLLAMVFVGILEGTRFARA